ncbi:MAG: nucleoid-associated protein, partial [Clostridia bacterium]|nr:nucleoid-associated protein [Clostridia bacterium]
KDEFVKQSNNLARHLYDQSIHPHISNGEFYVIYIDGCIINDETVDAVMLLKTEAKDNFLTVSYENGEYSIKSQLGLSTKHLDKGCIIFNTQPDNGYLISIVETSTIRQDGRYWSSNFLYIKEIITDFQHTEHIADFCSTVVRQISKENPEKFLDLAKASRKIIQILQNEGREVNTNELISSLAIDEEVASMLLSYKREYEKRSGEMPETFKIAQNAAKRKAITKANILKIGSDFELKILDSSAIIEQGYDDERKQNFLKLYYR